MAGAGAGAGARGEAGALGRRGAEGPPCRTAAEMREKWEGLWGAGLAPGDRFDARGPSPALLARLGGAHGGALGGVEGRRVLVPGCGRGYDLAAFMRAGAAEAVGLEISPTARDAAHEYLQGALEGALRGKARMELQDFFSEPVFGPEGLGQFDIVYDYTFFCAIDPQLRGLLGAGHGPGRETRRAASYAHISGRRCTEPGRGPALRSDSGRLRGAPPPGGLPDRGTRRRVRRRQPRGSGGDGEVRDLHAGMRVELPPRRELRGPSVGRGARGGARGAGRGCGGLDGERATP